MAVHLTRIYTRTGDDGTTGLSDFSRVAKSDPRVTAYADCDEANAAIGVALTLGALSPDIDALERWCDAYGESLPALDSFILPGGTPGSALLHQARTVVRRAERSAWAAIDAHPQDTSVLPAKYLNRLSDLLFILARVAAGPAGDVKWVPGGNRTRPDA